MRRKINDIPKLARNFFNILNEKVGPFDRPIQFRIFPFDAGGDINLLTVGNAARHYVTYVTWDLFGHPEQKRGRLGRYELVASCDDPEWCRVALTHVGRLGLNELLESGCIVGIKDCFGAEPAIQGILLEEALSVKLRVGGEIEPCGLLRCIGITRPEMEFAMRGSAADLIQRLKLAKIYPNTDTRRS